MDACKTVCVWTTVFFLVLGTRVFAMDAAVIKLPSPQMQGGMPLLQALRERHSTREFRAGSLPRQVLSNLLWAAAGVNRPESGKRTAPSARDWREISIYVATAEAVYRYDANRHALDPVVSGDLRAMTGVQDFVASAPVNLIYIADFDRMKDATNEQKNLYAAADTGFIAQNVYLYCASEGLATVVRGSVDREKLASALHLGTNQHIILAQTVGYPAGVQ